MKKTPRLFTLGILLLTFLFLFTGCKKENNPPVVSSVVVTPAIIDANAVAAVTVVATDLDGDPLTYAYSVNGGAITGSGPAVQWTAPPAAGAATAAFSIASSKERSVSVRIE